MKRIFFLVLSIILVLSITTVSKAAGNKEFSFIENEQLGNVKLYMNLDQLDKTIGNIKLTKKEGTNYYFANDLVVEISTYSAGIINLKGLVNRVSTTNPAHQTNRGIKVGDTRDKVIAVYGSRDGNDFDNVYEYKGENGNRFWHFIRYKYLTLPKNITMTFEFDKQGIVESISLHIIE